MLMLFLFHLQAVMQVFLSLACEKSMRRPVDHKQGFLTWNVTI